MYLTRIWLILFLSIFLGSSYAGSQTYSLDPLHTSVTWQINHFGFSNPSGKWMIDSGTLVLDENNLSKSSVTAKIQIDDVNSGITKLDENLIGNQFLNAADFPYATFVSTSVRQKSPHKLIVVGNLTLHGVTKPVTLSVIFNKIGIDPVSIHKTIGFSGTASIKRSDFGIKAYLPGLGDMVTLSIEAEAALAESPEAK